mmetsp:Transcript_29141/g.67564  ORF Transcript_29141/g.67564 Transcript_29141/m.67564 type:complete len:234 (-) Transcript_29141:889-1590(-)|eukprot:CAMPEP_0116844518 /NCGR_PEP_ID=MMETSP0418-20121206/12738_1 /TAXON_ID=1158023 /ORGANISM="Astrosyne radiata, Strain 13vi08-1A" /LENGTH=233 /DNA_ID=CAMNT_0004475491 /DNA_START=277 /DNA_END=978 /DNA_ORIENTATION=-
MSLATFQERAKAEATALMKNSSATLEALNAAYKNHFSGGKLSEVRKSFQDQNYLEENPAVVAALSDAQDAVAQALSDLRIVHDYVTLLIPKMEDGNNFGVTVQLAALKQIQDSSEELNKVFDEMPKYFSSRAEAVDKLGLKSESESETKKEEVEGDTTKTTTSKEWKSSTGKQRPLRVQAVYAIDIQYYASAQKAFRAAQSAYLANVDFVLKNTTKIEEPKGSSGGTNFSSMY